MAYFMIEPDGSMLDGFISFDFSTKLSVAVALLIAGYIFFPEQLTGDTHSAELFADVWKPLSQINFSFALLDTVITVDTFDCSFAEGL